VVVFVVRFVDCCCFCECGGLWCAVLCEFVLVMLVCCGAVYWFCGVYVVGVRLFYVRVVE